MSVPVLILAVPFVFYLVPFVAGYGWNAIGPYTPSSPAWTACQSASAATTAVEHYGPGVGWCCSRPGPAGLRAGRGTAALEPVLRVGPAVRGAGRGQPVLPAGDVRALLPTSWSNLVTFGMIGISSVALYGLLRLLGLSLGLPRSAAPRGRSPGCLYAECRAQQLCRPVRDDPAALPAATYCTTAHVRAYVTFAVVVAPHAVAGPPPDRREHLPAAGRYLVFRWIQTSRWGTRPGAPPLPLFYGLGSILAAPDLLPIVEAVRATHNKNVPFLAFLPMPWRTSVRSSSRGCSDSCSRADIRLLSERGCRLEQLRRRCSACSCWPCPR